MSLGNLGNRTCVRVTYRDAMECPVPTPSRVVSAPIPRYHDKGCGAASAASVCSGASPASTAESETIPLQNHPLRFRANSHDRRIVRSSGDSWMFSGWASERNVAAQNRRRMLPWREDSVSASMSSQDGASESGQDAGRPSSSEPSAADHRIWPLAVGSLATRCSQATGTRYEPLIGELVLLVLGGHHVSSDRAATASGSHQRSTEAARPPCVGPLDAIVDSRNRCAEHIVLGAVSRS